MYCLLTHVALRCKTVRWKSMNLEGSQYELLENKRNPNNYIYISIYIIITGGPG